MQILIFAALVFICIQSAHIVDILESKGGDTECD